MALSAACLVNPITVNPTRWLIQSRLTPLNTSLIDLMMAPE